MLIGAILAISAFCWQQREPGYRDRTLTSWLQQAEDTPQDETNHVAEAQDAIRNIGAEKAWPFLLKMAKARDGRVRSWLIRQGEERNIKFLKLRSADETQQLALEGFEILGTNGAPAVPALARLLNDTSHASTALRCLLLVGPPAEKVVCRALTNTDPEIRCISAQNLACVFDDVDPLLACLKNCLRDPASAVRIAAVGSIGDQTNYPNEAIPLLLLALEDPDGGVSSSAANVLAGFGTDAIVAITALTKAAGDEKPRLARNATRTLAAIAPKEALPFILKLFQSADSLSRHQALGLLCGYPVTNSEVQSVIELAATDADPNISRKAKEFITEQYEKGRPDELLFPDEPVYGGKRAGEWLKMHHDGWQLSNDAEDALCHLGTNAIPALMRRLAYVRPPFGLRAFDVNMEAVSAFIVLGDDAKSALPQLMALMDGGDEKVALYAMLAACNMGWEGAGCLVKGLTNQDATVRGEALNYLTQEVGDRFPARRKQAVSFLEGLVNDPDESVRINATEALKEFRSQATPKTRMN